MQARVLVVGLERDHYKELLPVLSRSLLDVERVSSAQGAVQLSQRAPLQLIIARYPLPDMALGSFMQGIHAAGSACASTPILFLADKGRLDEIRPLLPGGARQALSVDDPELVLKEAAALLKLSPRSETRVPVRVQVKLSGQPPVVYQSENFSENGMLLRSEGPRPPLGSRVAFEIALPGQGTVQGEAEVVRHAESAVERVHGIGLRVVAFRGDGAARIRRFVAGPARR